MIGRIEGIVQNKVQVKLQIDIHNQVNLIHLHVVFQDGDHKVIGEIVDIVNDIATITIIGEIRSGAFVPGFRMKPSFKSQVRLIQMDELSLIFGSQKIKDNGEVYFGLSNIYKNYRINIDINSFFSGHFAILGNTGSGKSYTVARLLQNVFTSSEYVPVGANIFLFDAYGEYTKAFSKLHEVSPMLHYKTITTNTKFPDTDILRIPLWLLGVDDLALLLGVTSASQLPIIEKALRLVPILKGDESVVSKHKNDIIARCVLDILMSGNDSSKIRDQVTAVLTQFFTKELSLESEIVEPGYIRTLKQCLFVDKSGKMQDMEGVIDFIQKFIVEGLELVNTEVFVPYNLSDLEQAFDLALISEGILQSDHIFDYANVLKVRLHSLASGDERVYFDYPQMVNRATFISSLLLNHEKKKCQIVNFNINYVNDRLAKVITKVLSKMLFDYASESNERGRIPYHIIIEEAHRYVQEDSDREILGYNIFDRITKEGRKYGVLLGLVTQRPSELSETTISQCSNFIILRTLHPRDLDYIKNMVPRVSSDIVEQLKTLSPGDSICFGTAFRVPTLLSIEAPNPAPLSSSADVKSAWYQHQHQQQ